MADSITYLAADLVAQVRVESDLVNSQVFTDDDVCTVISDAGSELRDIFTATWQKYDIDTFDFTLVGGVGLNSIALPQNFQRGHSIDVNPDTQQPFTLRYLPNWLNRNTCNMPFQIFGPGVFGPKAYTFLGDEIVVLPAVNANGIYRLYYTPTWTPLALPATVDVESAGIQISTAASNVSFSSSAFLDAVSGPWLSTDVGNNVVVTGAVNSGNNGSHVIASYTSATRVTLVGSYTPETLPPTATVQLLRNSRVSNAGVWTFYGNNPNSNSTIAVHAGDVMTVSGTPSNDGTYTITAAATGGNTITTGGTTIAENFPGTVTVTVQPKGTRATLPQNMNPWIQYIKTQAIISVRAKRGMPVESFEARLQTQKDRIATILQERQEEPTQPPVMRGSNNMFGIGDGGGGFGGSW